MDFNRNTNSVSMAGDRGKRSESRREWAFALIVSLPSVAYYLNYCMKIFDIPCLASRICLALLLALGLYSMGSLLLKRPDFAVAVVAAVTLLLSTSALMFGNSLYLFGQDMSLLQLLLLSNISKLCFECISPLCLYLAGLSVRDALRKANPFAVAAIMLQVVVFILTTTFGRDSISSDYMSFAYYAFIPLLIIAYNGSSRLHEKALIALGLLLVFISGCRGAVVTLAACLVFFLTLRLFGSSKIKKAPAIAAIFAAILLILFFDQLVTTLSQLLNSIGFSSRTLDSMLSESDAFFSGSGRDVLYQTALQNINFTGHGLFGDRSVVDGISSSALDGASIAEGAYVHNWVLELFLDFGWFFGALMVVAVLIISVKGFFAARNELDYRASLLAAFSLSMIFGRYMLSASLFTSTEFMFAIIMLDWITKERNSVFFRKNS